MVNTPLTLVAGNPTVNSDRWWSWLLYSFSFTGNPKRDRHLRTAAGVWLLDNFNKLFFLSFFLILDKLWNNELQCDMLPTILLCEFCLSNALSCCSHRTVRLLPPLSVFTTRCTCKHTDTCMWGILFCCFFVIHQFTINTASTLSAIITILGGQISCDPPLPRGDAWY